MSASAICPLSLSNSRPTCSCFPARKFMSVARIALFSISSCPHCAKAKGILNSKGWSFIDINLTEHPDRRRDMLLAAHQLSVPQIFFNGLHIGGASDLERLDKQGMLESLYLKMNQEELNINPLLLASTDTPKQGPVVSPRTNNKFPIKLKDEEFSFGDISSFLKRALTFKSDFAILKTPIPFFYGQGLADLLLAMFGLLGDSSSEVADALIEMGVMQCSSGGLKFAADARYHLYQDTHKFCLNECRKWTDRVDHPIYTLNHVKSQLANVIEKYRNADDGLVDYILVRDDVDFLNFEESVCEFTKFDLAALSISGRRAFLINAYNLIVLHAMIKVGAPTNSLSRLQYFDLMGYNIGGEFYSMSDIEHGLLRENSIAPYHFSTQFKKNDSRLRIMIPKDPRIHFALNCGAKSCPPIKSFTEVGIEEELDIVAEAFLEQSENLRVDDVSKTLHLSKILDWYKEDFGTKPELVAKSLSKWDRTKRIDSLLSQPFKITYELYDWSNDSSRILEFNLLGDL